MRSYEIRLLTTNEAMYQTYGVLRCLNESITESEYKEYIDYFTSKSYRQFALFIEEKPISVIAVSDAALLGEWPKRTFKIDNVGTLEEERGSGVSGVLMNYVLEYMRRHGYSSTYLNCDKNNSRGNRFYEKMGFDKDVKITWAKRIEEEKDSSITI